MKEVIVSRHSSHSIQFRKEQRPSLVNTYFNMVYFRSAAVVALLVASPGLAEASSVKSPKKANALRTSKKDNSLQTFKAKKVESSTISQVSLSKASDDENSHSSMHRSGDKLQRQMMQARTTLENVDIDNLEPAEIMFYEDSLKTAVEMAQDQDDTGNQVSLRSVIVEDDHDNQKKHGRRGLRGGRDRKGTRALWGWNRGWSKWYDIWAFVEVSSCRFCGRSDDDDFQNRVVGNTRKRRFDDDDDNEYMGVTPMRDIKHGYHRALGVSENFETILCDLLQEGPHERLQQATKCVVEFVEW
jgi:hypothetical protein